MECTELTCDDSMQQVVRVEGDVLQPAWGQLQSSPSGEAGTRANRIASAFGSTPLLNI